MDNTGKPGELGTSVDINSSSDGEESSDKDSTVQVSHSDMEDSLVVITTKGDKVIVEDSVTAAPEKPNIEDNFSVEISKQDEASDSKKQQRNNNFTAEVKGADSPKQEKPVDYNVTSTAHYEKGPVDPIVTG